jgi:Zn-dependent protease with chaperone function
VGFVTPGSEAIGCPRCGASIPVVHGLVNWCDACDWNLSAPESRAPRTARERLYAKAGRRIGDRVVSRLGEAGSLAPRLTATRLAAYLVASLVHLLTAALALTGLLILVEGFPSPFALFGLLFLGPAVLMRPRLGRVPESGRVTREQAPQLYRFIDEVAETLGTRTADVIIIDEFFNASWSVRGIRRRRVLTLGLPLLTALTPPERTALVAHELSHARNGDAGRGLFVGSAVDALFEQYMVLAPTGSAGAGFVIDAVMWLVSRPSKWLLQLEWHLLLHDSQRAEYIADSCAADVAGTDAVVSLHEKLLLGTTFRGVVQHAARSKSDIFDELLSVFERVPERERLRRRRVARLEAARLDASHPPTAKRIELLERRPHVTPTVDGSGAVLVDEELRPFRAGIQDRLVDGYRASVHDR